MPITPCNSPPSPLPLKIVSVCQGINFRIFLDHNAKVIILKFTAKLLMSQQALLLFVVILITVIMKKYHLSMM